MFMILPGKFLCHSIFPLNTVPSIKPTATRQWLERSARTDRKKKRSKNGKKIDHSEISIISKEKTDTNPGVTSKWGGVFSP